MPSMKTLVIAPNWIGDALMAQPLLTLLKQADPSQKIVCLAPRWVAPVLEAMPEVDRVLSTELAHGRLQWKLRRQFAQAVRALHFDRVFVLPNSLKSALIPWLARIPQRIGYRGEARYVLLDRRVKGPDPSLAMSERYAALAGAVGLTVPKVLPLPRLIADSIAVEAVRMRFGFGAFTELVALCPGAEFGPAKRWPAAHFATLASTLLADRPRARVLLLGGKGDRAIADAIVAGTTPADTRLLNLCGETDLGEAIALIATSSAIVSNDSGLMHVAAALSRPQVALFGSSDPRHTPPLSPHAKTLWLHLDCSPCFERVCPLGHLNCLVGITPRRVFDSMQNTSPAFPTRPVADR